MVNFDEIDFLESEIVDDDDNAPVGTLIHITDDGKVEEIKPETQSALSYNSLESTDKTAGSTDDIQENPMNFPPTPTRPNRLTLSTSRQQTCKTINTIKSKTHREQIGRRR